MLAMSRRQWRHWIVLTVGACCLAACSTQGTSPEAAESPSPSKQTRESGDEPAADAPQTTPTRSSDGSLLIEAAGCKVYAQRASGRIRWYTPGDSQNCQAWIHRYKVSNGKYEDTSTGFRDITDKQSYYSDWYPTTPGDEVCVNNAIGQLECEPEKQG